MQVGTNGDGPDITLFFSVREAYAIVIGTLVTRKTIAESKFNKMKVSGALNDLDAFDNLSSDELQRLLDT